ncbi:MAG: 7-carboxy-7-deazaguanine synthase QueE [Planctomycetota bacterium]
MLISEIYQSRQGEGLLTGTPSIFVRTSGCNLRCSFCDTPFTSWEPDGSKMTVAEIMDATSKYDAGHVVITGGEPAIQRELGELCAEFNQAGIHITIETAGTVELEVACDLMSISPKLRNSTPSVDRAGGWSRKHEQSRKRPDVLNQLMSAYEHQLKYVVSHPDDLAEIVQQLESLDGYDPARVLLMPEGIQQSDLEEKETWLRPLCAEYGFVFCPRLHILWYGNKRGT